MWSDSIAVHPWIGKNFNNPQNFIYKTLILGESNFTEVEKFKYDHVINCVINDISVDPKIERDTLGFCRFSTKIRRIIFGRKEGIGINNFWQDVAFYNFVQFLVGDKARIRPTNEMWVESIKAFLEVILLLQPTKVLVLGKANWENLLRHIDHEAIDLHTVRLKVGPNQVVAGYINHPSSSLIYDEWHPIAHKLLFT